MACVHVLRLKEASHGIEDLPMLSHLTSLLPTTVEVIFRLVFARIKYLCFLLCIVLGTAIESPQQKCLEYYRMRKSLYSHNVS